MPIATITSKGQVTLPKKIRDKLHLETGQKVDFRIDKSSETATLIPLNKKVDDVFGILASDKRRKAISVTKMDKAIKKKFRMEYR